MPRKKRHLSPNDTQFRASGTSLRPALAGLVPGKLEPPGNLLLASTHIYFNDFARVLVEHDHLAVPMGIQVPLESQCHLAEVARGDAGLIFESDEHDDECLYPDKTKVNITL